jgi:hypothetical protein
LFATTTRAISRAVEIAGARAGTMDAFARVAGIAARAAICAIGRQVDTDPITHRILGRADARSVETGFAIFTVGIIAAAGADPAAAALRPAATTAPGFQDARLATILLAPLAFFLLPLTFLRIGLAGPEPGKKASETGTEGATKRHPPCGTIFERPG